MIRAYIQESYIGLSNIHVLIVDHREGTTPVVMRVDEHGRTDWEHFEEAAMEPPAPTLTLPHDTGRVLLEALTRHYQGAEDTRQLRLDYERERTRVDKHAEALADIARTLAAKEAQR